MEERQIDPRLKDFRNFLYLIFIHLGITQVTRIQYSIANRLQHGPKRQIVMGFRGMGKSWITAAFVLWCLYVNPQAKIMVVSASKSRASDFTQFLLQLIRDVEFLRFLEPRDDQRQSMEKFDVGPATPDQSPSIKCVGINGTLTGSRADIIIADDIEIPKNSATELQRQKLAESVKEFDAVLKPGGRVVYLGTPQCEFSLYAELQKRGYGCRIWPVRYPDEDRCAYYGERLDPDIKSELDANQALVGTSTEPSRFNEADLQEREASYGRSGFSLQFMLDTRLSDLYRYPLKINDMMVMDCNPDLGPELPIWASSPDVVISDLPNAGMTGDRFHRPMRIQGDFVSYTGSVMAIDPSGRGKDELAYVILKFLNGYLYFVDLGAFIDGYSETNLQAVADAAKKYKVQHVVIEANYGDGMFTKLLHPYFTKRDPKTGLPFYPVTIDEVKHSKQKELRIIDTLEPILTQHRLIVDSAVIRKDNDIAMTREGETCHQYQLFHQLSRITREKGCLVRDDRLDALAMAVTYYTEQMLADAQKEIDERRSALLEEELKSFLENANSIYNPNPTGPLWYDRF